MRKTSPVEIIYKRQSQRASSAQQLVWATDDRQETVQRRRWRCEKVYIPKTGSGQATFRDSVGDWNVDRPVSSLRTLPAMHTEKGTRMNVGEGLTKQGIRYHHLRHSSVEAAERRQAVVGGSPVGDNPAGGNLVGAGTLYHVR